MAARDQLRRRCGGEATSLAIVDALQAYEPRTATQKAFYSAAATQPDLFLGERENRVAKAGTEIPAPLVALLTFLAITTICVSFFIKTHRASVDLALVVVVSVIVASGFLTALILQYPYSGSIAVTSDPLTKGPLSRLSQGT